MNFNLASSVKQYPKLPFGKIAAAILPKSYELSLTFVGEQRAQRLNYAYRNKTYIPNVLSFPLDKTHGEIFICPSVAAREAKQYRLSLSQYVAYLFIHGCIHLKGYDHGATMERLERRYLAQFGYQPLPTGEAN